MNKNYLLVYLWLAIWTPTMSASYNIDFSQGPSFTKVFDSGIRPTRIAGLENAVCEARKVSCSISLRDGSTIPELDCELVKFHVAPGHQVPRIELRSLPLSTQDALVKVRPLLRLLGQQPKEFETWIETVNENPLHFEGFYSKGRGGDKDTPGLVVSFQRTGIFRSPIALVLTLSHEPIEGGRYQFLREPIQPPPGYEHISLDPEKALPTDARDASEEGSPRDSNGQATRPQLEKAIVELEAEAASDETISSSVRLWPWIVITASALGVLSWLFLKRRS